MKILILTCSTGEGPNSAAQALRDVLINKSVECQVVDSISFASKKNAKRRI